MQSDASPLFVWRAGRPGHPLDSPLDTRRGSRFTPPLSCLAGEGLGVARVSGSSAVRTRG